MTIQIAFDAYNEAQFIQQERVKLINKLKNEHKLVSFRERSVPSAGSPCYKTSKLNTNSITDIKEIINHRNGDITIFTEYGYLRFWGDSNYND